MGKEMGDLADAYLRHYRRTRAEAAIGQNHDPQDPDAEAVDRVLDLTLNDDVEALWEVNIELLKRCQSLYELSYVAAGPVEDMLNRIGDAEIGTVLKRASEDPLWKYAIAGTYTSRMTPRLAAAIERIQRENTVQQLEAATGLSG